MKANFDLIDEDFDEATPVVHIISDSLGDTASEVVNAAAGQFPNESVRIERLAKVTSVEQVRHYFDEKTDPEIPMAVFHTIVDSNLRAEVRRELDRRAIPSIDLMGPAITVLSTLTGKNLRTFLALSTTQMVSISVVLMPWSSLLSMMTVVTRKIFRRQILSLSVFHVLLRHHSQCT